MTAAAVIGALWSFLSGGGWLLVAGAAAFAGLKVKARSDRKAGEAAALSRIEENDHAAAERVEAAVAAVAAADDADLDGVLDRQAVVKHGILRGRRKPRDRAEP